MDSKAWNADSSVKTEGRQFTLPSDTTSAVKGFKSNSGQQWIRGREREQEREKLTLLRHKKIREKDKERQMNTSVSLFVL